MAQHLKKYNVGID